MSAAGGVEFRGDRRLGYIANLWLRTAIRVQEKIIKGSGIEWASFRPTLVYGVGDQRHTAPFLRRCAAGKGTYWVPHDGTSKINPVHVDDVVDAIMKYFDFDRGVDCCYELAGPAGIPYNEFVDQTQFVGTQCRHAVVAPHQCHSQCGPER